MITVSANTPWPVLEDQVRHVPLLQTRQNEIVYPYLDAQITLREIAYDDVQPTSMYALQDNLALQTQLAADLAPEYDPLGLRGGLTLYCGDGTNIGLIPPIVEETETEGKYILDGLHRTYVGFKAGRTVFIAIHIVGFRPDCPSAALPNAWSDIIVYDEVPSDPTMKRRYRDNPLGLRRDFSALNGSRPRL